MTGKREKVTNDSAATKSNYDKSRTELRSKI